MRGLDAAPGRSDRRAFLCSIGSGLLVWPFTAFAQQPAKVHRIGVLANTEAPTWDGLHQGLRELDYVDGRTIAMVWRWAQGQAERFSDFAIELVQLHVDIIVTSSTQAARAAKRATSSIPILMANSGSPEKFGLVECLARPGGNITGLSNVAPELLGKRPELP